MFSLLPRGQGLRGAQKETGTPVFTLNRACWAILFPLVPGERAAQLLRELDDIRGERVRDDIGGMTVGKCDQHDEAGCVPPTSPSHVEHVAPQRCPPGTPDTAGVARS